MHSNKNVMVPLVDGLSKITMLPCKHVKSILIDDHGYPNWELPSVPLPLKRVTSV